MNDHNLDDLIIDTIAPKNNKTKSLLTIVALLIIILIVGIILSKTLLKSPENDELTFEENVTKVIAPELKLQEVTEVAKPKEEPSLSTIIEEKVTETKPEVKAPEIIGEETIVTEEQKTPHKETVIEEKKKVAPVKAEKAAIELPVTQEPAPKKTPKVVTKTKTKSTVKKPVAKHQTATSGTYYVQVGSFKQNPSPRFLAVIKSSGFSYHVSKPDALGNKKLLIGPYKTRADVDKALAVVRDRIHKSAFVVQK